MVSWSLVHRFDTLTLVPVSFIDMSSVPCLQVNFIQTGYQIVRTYRPCRLVLSGIYVYKISQSFSL